MGNIPEQRHLLLLLGVFVLVLDLVNISIKAHHTQPYTKEQKVQKALTIKDKIDKEWMKGRHSKNY